MSSATLVILLFTCCCSKASNYSSNVPHKAFGAPSPLGPHSSDRSKSRSPTASDAALHRTAFATMLCKSPHSTFDRPDGEGAELGALVHGHAINATHAAKHPLVYNIDSVLLHVVIPGVCSESFALVRPYDERIHTLCASRTTHVPSSSSLLSSATSRTCGSSCWY